MSPVLLSAAGPFVIRSRGHGKVKGLGCWEPQIHHSKRLPVLRCHGRHHVVKSRYSHRRKKNMYILDKSNTSFNDNLIYWPLPIRINHESRSFCKSTRKLRGLLPSRTIPAFSVFSVETSFNPELMLGHTENIILIFGHEGALPLSPKPWTLNCFAQSILPPPGFIRASFQFSALPVSLLLLCFHTWIRHCQDFLAPFVAVLRQLVS